MGNMMTLDQLVADALDITKKNFDENSPEQLVPFVILDTPENIVIAIIADVKEFYNGNGRKIVQAVMDDIPEINQFVLCCECVMSEKQEAEEGEGYPTLLIWGEGEDDTASITAIRILRTEGGKRRLAKQPLQQRTPKQHSVGGELAGLLFRHKLMKAKTKERQRELATHLLKLLEEKLVNFDNGSEKIIVYGKVMGRAEAFVTYVTTTAIIKEREKD